MIKSNSKTFFFLIFALILAFVLFCLYRKHSNIEETKQEIGYRHKTEISSVDVIQNELWKGMILDNDIRFTDGAHNIVPYDLDEDGHLELIANSYRSDTLIIYKYEDNPHLYSNWSRIVLDSSVGGGIPRKPLMDFIKHFIAKHFLGDFIGGAHYTAISDMNNDGLKDLIVAGDLKEDDIVWYQTPRNIVDVSKWIKHISYKNNDHRTYHLETGDIDNDGFNDVVFVSKTDNQVGWLRNSPDSPEWPFVWVDKECIRSFNARITDINMDGFNDIIASEDDSVKGGKIHLYSCTSDPFFSSNWENIIIASFPTGHGVSVFELTDIDNDNDMDIVTGNHQGDLYIIENPFPETRFGEWKKYKVNDYDIQTGHDIREIDVGDINGDGYYDIIVADEGRNAILWFENNGPTFYENWLLHILDQSDDYLAWCHSVELGDIDEDGDLDVIVSAAGSNVFLIYFNLTTS